MNVSALKLACILAVSMMAVSARPCAAACTANNHIRPADLLADEIHQHLVDKRYKQLDALFEQYVNEKTATPDGISALSIFFKGIADGFNYCAQKQKTDEEWAAHQADLSDWSQASPNSAGPKFAMAMFTLDQAWYGRGGGTFANLSAQTRETFKARISSAQEQLQALADTSRSNPAWYAAMIQIGQAEGWPAAAVDAYYTTAVKLDPYYVELHFTMAEFYSPQWYGSSKLQAELIERATESTRERLGQTMYTRLQWTHSDSPTMFKKKLVSWKRMKTGFDDYLRIFSENKTRNSYARFACYANDRATLKQVWQQLGDMVDPQTYPGQAWYKKCARAAL